MTGTLPRTHLGAVEFADALRALSDADFMRLRKKATFRALGSGFEGDDLLSEAIRRTVEGLRKCPVRVSIVTFLDNAMRSIADGEREKYNREQPSANADGDDDLVGRYPDNSSSPEDAAIARIDLEKLLNRIQEIFHDDAQALAIVMGDSEGWSLEDVREMEGMSEAQYLAARKRVRRAIAKMRWS
ncbi:MAG: RNA polymerase sigma factor [Alphaproteobacteria bacterium]